MIYINNFLPFLLVLKQVMSHSGVPVAQITFDQVTLLVCIILLQPVHFFTSFHVEIHSQVRKMPVNAPPHLVAANEVHLENIEHDICGHDGI